MSENCNGGSLADGDIPNSGGGPVETRIPVKNTEGGQFPLDRVFHGFIRIPCVYLARYDISPYLNGSKKTDTPSSTAKRKVKSILKNNECTHEKRLSQKCAVSLVRKDLVSLKASYSKSRKPSLKPDFEPDSDCSDTEMAFKCKTCSKCYDSEKKLFTHQRKKHIIYLNSKPMKRVSFSEHVIIHEVKEYHKCRKCPKIFEDYRSLKLHTKQQHKKRKCYICNYCNKSFAERMIFKIHIKLHCDVCGQLFLNKAKCLEHKRNVCRVIKLHKCKSCGESFYNVLDLKDHGYEHNISGFVCDVCKDQFESKCMIAHHISFLHRKKRPRSMYTMRKMGNERLYLCNFCEESSVERDIVERHIEQLPDLKNRAMTGISDHYFCDVCKKTFATEHEMLQHKWTHFLKTDTSQKPLKELEPVKTTFNINNPLPLHFQPKLVLKRLNLEEGSSKPLEFIDINIDLPEIHPQNLKKAIVDPKSKKTLISRHQCEMCEKFFSTNYCLNRHIATQHIDYENLRCRVCEETFVWPSLLRSHKCIRVYHNEMPFEDARPEIHFDNLNETQYGFDDFNINDEDDYMSTIDFEIPAPIVELTEGDTFLSLNQSLPKMNQGLGQSQPRMNQVLSQTQPRMNQVLSQTQPRMNQVLSQTHPRMNQVLSQTQPRMNQVLSQTHPRMNQVLSQTQPRMNQVLSQTHPKMNQVIQDKNCQLQSLGYNLVMQEVPIEF